MNVSMFFFARNCLKKFECSQKPHIMKNNEQAKKKQIPLIGEKIKTTLDKGIPNKEFYFRSLRNNNRTLSRKPSFYR